jgi:dipeptidyl-peptidase-4
VPLDGELYLATLDGKVTRLTQEKGPSSIAVISPAGGYVSYVRTRICGRCKLATGGAARSHRGRQRHGPLGRGRVRRAGGNGPLHRLLVVAGRPLHRRRAVRRGAGGRVTRTAIGAEGTSTFQQRYPKAGTANVLVDLYVMDPAGTNKVKVDLGKETDIYLTRVDWAKDGKTRSTSSGEPRPDVLDMLKVDPATGKSSHPVQREIGAEELGEPVRRLPALDDGSLIWWSERDGHGHLYRWKAGKWTQLTKRRLGSRDRARRRGRGEGPRLLPRQQGRRARAAALFGRPQEAGRGDAADRGGLVEQA